MEISWNKMNNKYTKTISLGDVRKALIGADLIKTDETLSYIQTNSLLGNVDICVEKTN